MKKKKKISEEDSLPLCPKCGNAMIFEDGEWVCPHCQGEIKFLDEDE